MAWSTAETKQIEELLNKGLRGNDLLPFFKGRTHNQIWQKADRIIIKNGLPKSREDANAAKSSTSSFTLPQLPSGTLTAQEILDTKRRRYELQDEHQKATSLIRAKIHTTGPICVACFGDPHLDDDGCDTIQLEADIDACKGRSYVFPMCIGDYTNNWVGRLQALYANQSTTITDAHILIEWFFAELPWLLAIGGNHDHWSGKLDKAASAARSLNILYAMHGQRIALDLPSGKEVRINARHDHKGHSQFHPTHGVIKTAFFGERDHINVAGHIHRDGYLTQKIAGLRTHAIRVGTYKRHDDFGKQLGHPDDSTPSYGIVIDPRFTEADDRFITVFASLAQAVEYTEMLRQKAS